MASLAWCQDRALGVSGCRDVTKHRHWDGLLASFHRVALVSAGAIKQSLSECLGWASVCAVQVRLATCVVLDLIQMTSLTWCQGRISMVVQIQCDSQEFQWIAMGDSFAVFWPSQVSATRVSCRSVSNGQIWLEDLEQAKLAWLDAGFAAVAMFHVDTVVFLQSIRTSLAAHVFTLGEGGKWCQKCCWWKHHRDRERKAQTGP